MERRETKDKKQQNKQVEAIITFERKLRAKNDKLKKKEEQQQQKLKKKEEEKVGLQKAKSSSCLKENLLQSKAVPTNVQISKDDDFVDTDEILATLLPQSHRPDTVEVWIQELEDDDDHMIWQDQGEAVLPWLIQAVKYSHLDPAIKNAVKQLLLKSNFTGNLQSLGCWNSLQNGMRTILDGLALRLLHRYNQLNLSVNLSDVALGKHTLPLHDVIRSRKMPDAPLSTSDLLPGISSHFDFECFEDCPERVFLILMQMIAEVVNAKFQAKLQELTRNFGIPDDDLRGAPPKKYARAMNKSQSDYVGRVPPRTGYNIDVIRSLLLLPDAASIITVLHALVKDFNGIAQLKNLYSLPEDERAARFHLLTVMLTVVMDTGMTFGEMSKNPENRKIWEDFGKKVPTGEPRERWESMCGRALKYLNHTSIADEVVYVFGEVQIILKDDATVRHQMHTVYKVFRAETPDQLLADFLDSYGVRPKEVQSTSVFDAASRGQLSVVKQLLSQGQSIEEAKIAGVTPLIIASENNHPDVVKCLFAANARVNHTMSGGATALYVASERNHLDIVKLLVAHNAVINGTETQTMVPLGIASKKNHMEVVKFLLSNNASVNTSTNRDANPLYCASQRGHIEMVQLLHSRGAAIDNPISDGTTALWIAAANNHLEVVRFLHSHGAGVDTADLDHGSTPLMKGAQSNLADIVKFLLANNAAINKVDNDVRSALNVAARQGHTEIVKLLCETPPGADLSVNGKWGTALNEATDKNNVEVVHYLRSRGAEE
eukprot:m.185090 g.185090  ORF g.185090 m.185090 type:complete len:773 (+) comp32218_c0_seq1:123-2441(+)